MFNLVNGGIIVGQESQANLLRAHPGVGKRIPIPIQDLEKMNSKPKSKSFQIQSQSQNL